MDTSSQQTNPELRLEESHGELVTREKPRDASGRIVHQFSWDASGVYPEGEGADAGSTFWRVGRWSPGYYQLGESKIRLFAVAFEDVHSWENCKAAATWGLQQTISMSDCSHKARHDYYTGTKIKIACGYHNTTSNRWAWAGFRLYYPNGISGCESYFNYTKDAHGDYGWHTVTWLTGADHQRISLQFADNDANGLSWGWHF